MNISNEKIERMTDCTVMKLTDGNAEIKASKVCAVVSECDFEGCDFEQTNLSGNRFASSDMSGCYFEEVNLSGAAFERSSLCGAAFEDVNLRGAAFESCDFSGVEFIDCKLDGMTVNGYDISELIEFYKNNHKENG